MKLTFSVFLVFISTVLIFSNGFGANVDDGLAARNVLTDKTKRLFEAGKFAELDALADSLYKNHAVFADGGYKLRSYTDAFDMCVDGRLTYPDWVFTVNQEKAEKWRKVNPRSVAARIASAYAWLGYACKARGNSRANEANDSSSSLFCQRLDTARQILNEPLAPGMADSPERHVLLLRIANYQGGSRTEFERLFQEAVRLYPEYDEIYSRKAEYLSQKWHGRKGEWQNFIMDLARRNKGGHGKTLYTRTAWSRSDEWSDFKQDGISWTVMKNGFQEIVRKHPGSPYVLNNFAKFACVAKDKKTLADLFRRMKPEQLYPEVWNHINFDDCLSLVEADKHR